jgi:hypothetical protein
LEEICLTDHPVPFLTPHGIEVLLGDKYMDLYHSQGLGKPKKDKEELGKESGYSKVYSMGLWYDSSGRVPV